MYLVSTIQQEGISMKITIKKCPICGYGKPKHEFHHIVCPRCALVYEFQGEKTDLDKHSTDKYKGKYIITFDIVDQKLLEQERREMELEGGEI